MILRNPHILTLPLLVYPFRLFGFTLFLHPLLPKGALMASSSPPSEPPSSPPRTPSHDRSRKRGSYDPSTPRTARHLRSTTPRPGPAIARSPGREGSKGKGKEVVTPLTLKNCGPLVANVISHLGGQPIGNEDEYEDSDEDSDESEQTSPAPAAAKNKGPVNEGKSFAGGRQSVVGTGA